MKKNIIITLGIAFALICAAVVPSVSARVAEDRAMAEKAEEYVIDNYDKDFEPDDIMVITDIDVNRDRRTDEIVNCKVNFNLNGKSYYRIIHADWIGC